MCVRSPTMQSTPMRVSGPRTWTPAQIAVPAPISTPSSISAVGWIRAPECGGVMPPAHGTEVLDLADHARHLVVAVTEPPPFGARVLAVPRALPPDADRALRAVQREVGVGGLLDAPREVDGAEHSVRRAQQHRRGVL